MKYIQTEKCCEGYVKKGNLGCVRDETKETSPCGNLTCDAVPEAQCKIITKCGKEVGVFMYEGKIAHLCQDDSSATDLLSCSGVCIHDPCANANCPAFDQSEVFCFPSGCDCQTMWIRRVDKREVDCLTGETINKEESHRRKRQSCE